MDYFSPERRKQNSTQVMKALDSLQLDFNSLVFAFTDIIQATFINGACIAATPAERKQFFQDSADLAQKLADVLNENKANQLIDIVALTNLIMSAVEMGTQAALADIEKKRNPTTE